MIYKHLVYYKVGVDKESEKKSHIIKNGDSRTWPGFITTIRYIFKNKIDVTNVNTECKILTPQQGESLLDTTWRLWKLVPLSFLKRAPTLLKYVDTNFFEKTEDIIINTNTTKTFSVEEKLITIFEYAKKEFGSDVLSIASHPHLERAQMGFKCLFILRKTSGLPKPILFKIFSIMLGLSAGGDFQKLRELIITPTQTATKEQIYGLPEGKLDV